MWGFLSALISGALMSIQGVFNTNVTKQTSLWVSTGWVQFSAFLVCVAAWFFTGRESIGMLWQVEDKYNLPVSYTHLSMRSQELRSASSWQRKASVVWWQALQRRSCLRHWLLRCV